MAESVTFTGLGSGIDLKSIVDAMVETEKIRYIQPLENWKSHWTEMSTAFTTLDTKLASFHSTVKSLDTPSEFLVNTASSSDSNITTATSASGAVEGSYEIEVVQLAQADKWIHNGIADDDSFLTTDVNKVFSYTYDGTIIDINVTVNSTTLNGLADAINGDPTNPGVTASVLDDGLGTGTSFHLILTGETTGSDYAITINSGATATLAEFDEASEFTNNRTAQDALIIIDDYPPVDDPQTFITRSSNSIGDVISDISLELTGIGIATISINTDTSAIKENITTFIDKLNEIRQYIKEQTAYNTDTNKAGILLGNYGADIVKNKINEILSSTATGFRDGYETFINLMQVGIKTDVDEGSETQGQLIIDEAVLSKALTENPQAVANLFADYYSGRSAHDGIVYDSHITGITEAGTYEISFNPGNPPDVQMRIKGGEWHPADWNADTNIITGEEGYPESGLAVKITDPGTTISKSNPAEVDLKLGIMGTLKEELDFLTNPYSGTMSVLEENYQDIIASIDDKIEREENRIALYQKRLEIRYARLEALLTSLNGQSSMLDSQIQKLE
jgi:flagellar hook-associated protein 2